MSAIDEATAANAAPGEEVAPTVAPAAEPKRRKPRERSSASTELQERMAIYERDQIAAKKQAIRDGMSLDEFGDKFNCSTSALSTYIDYAVESAVDSKDLQLAVATINAVRYKLALDRNALKYGRDLDDIAQWLEGAPRLRPMVGIYETDRDQRVARLYLQAAALRARLRAAAAAFAAECANEPEPAAPGGDAS